MYDADYFEWPRISRQTIQKVCRQLEEGKTSFDLALFEQFEAELCRYFDVSYALLTCNGTSAALSAFFALELKHGDEIIAPPYTHWATVIPATLLGCKIVFADLEADSLSLDVQAAEEKITDATKAIVVCHLYGNPVDIEAFRELCDEKGLHLIEDISHAPGATVNGKKIGAFGDIAFMSFQASKVISGGEGGALLTNCFDFYARAVELGHPKRIFRLPPEWQAYNRVGLGYKFRLSPILALLAYESFKALEQVNALRKEMCEALRRSLLDLPDIKPSIEVSGANRVYFRCEFFVCQWPKTQVESKPGNIVEMVELLRASQLNVDPPNYEFLPDLPHFRNSPVRTEPFPNARRLLNQLILVSPFTKKSEKMLEKYVNAFHNIFQRAKE